MTGFRPPSPLPRLASMAQQATAARAVVVTALVGAAAVLLAVLALVGSSLLVRGRSGSVAVAERIVAVVVLIGREHSADV